MATLNDSTNLSGTITLSKATGTKVTLDTDKKYITKDIELTINAPTTTATANGLTVSYGSGWINSGSTTCSDANLVAGNIKKNVSIFGVTGTYDGGMPIFTVNMDSSYSVTSATCNKTYNEISNWFYNEDRGDARVLIYAPDDEYEMGGSITRIGNQFACVVMAASLLAMLVIYQDSSNNLTWVEEPWPMRDENDVTISGPTVTVPYGAYWNNTSVTVASADPTFTGGTISGTATANSSNATISSTQNNSGVIINAAASATRTQVTYNGAVAGWVSKSNGDQALAASNATQLTGTAYYINGVTLTKPTSGTRTFAVTVPNGATTATFVFNVDTSGNVTITES